MGGWNIQNGQVENHNILALADLKNHQKTEKISGAKNGVLQYTLLNKTGQFRGVRRGGHFSGVLGGASFSTKFWGPQTTRNQPKAVETNRNPWGNRNLVFTNFFNCEHLYNDTKAIA